jgi:hypothetical protein
MAAAAPACGCSAGSRRTSEYKLHQAQPPAERKGCKHTKTKAVHCRTAARVLKPCRTAAHWALRNYGIERVGVGRRGTGGLTVKFYGPMQCLLLSVSWRLGHLWLRNSSPKQCSGCSSLTHRDSIIRVHLVRYWNNAVKLDVSVHGTAGREVCNK